MNKTVKLDFPIAGMLAFSPCRWKASAKTEFDA
jgi:hypothetical protein